MLEIAHRMTVTMLAAIPPAIAFVAVIAVSFRKTNRSASPIYSDRDGRRFADVRSGSWVFRGFSWGRTRRSRVATDTGDSLVRVCRPRARLPSPGNADDDTCSAQAGTG